jgi:hypothetical protein
VNDKKKDSRENPISQNAAKPAYQSPVIVNLGEIARGSGKCNPGSNGKASGDLCIQGNNPKA